MYYPELPENCDDAILEFIDTTKEEGIPVDGFQLSSGYCAIETEQGIKRCSFTWNYKRFKDPADCKDEAGGHRCLPECKAGNASRSSTPGGDEGKEDVRPRQHNG